MKKTLFFALCCALLTHLAAAQQTPKSPSADKPQVPALKGGTPTDPAARSATEQLVAKYTLNADQAKQMYTVQLRKLRNLSQIADLKTTDIALYKSKLQNVQSNTLVSVRRILNTKAQVEIYQKTQADLRAQRAQKREEMLRQNAERGAIELALLDIYAE
jgi:hypothetical protein